MNPALESPWDVLIIGGGPAGATAAILLARQGRRVLVVEKEIFPRFHVGESLLPYNGPLFEQLGVAEALRAAGFMVKRAAQFHSGAGSPGARLTFAKGRFTEHPSAMQVQRDRFDQILLNAARTAGAEVREGCSAGACVTDADGVAVELRAADGTREPVRARFVMDASGMSTLTARAAGLKEARAGHSKVALFSHFDNVEMPTGEELGDIILLLRDQAWVWLIPLTETRTSVGLVMDRSEFDSGRGDLEGLWDRIVRETPDLARRLSAAIRVGKLHVEADYSYEVKKIVEPRLVRIGDAAGFLDPVFSSGVMLAMESAVEASAAVAQALDRGATMTRALRRYEAHLRDHLALFWRFVRVFYTRPFVELFLQPRPKWDLLSGINAVLAGRSRLPWTARWRLEVFFLLVKLQSWYPVVPRLRWSTGRPPTGRGFRPTTQAG
ncbi:MAG: tryptophan 7-halogenase [Verrucomicrobiales bacterium]|nr:tryptophan 7-halogenase [Verrucomicrobiales bacterium]